MPDTTPPAEISDSAISDPVTERTEEAAERDSIADSSSDSVPAWPWWKRIGFRFLAAYFLLYALPFPLNAVPWPWLSGTVSTWTRALWEAPTLWV